MKTTIKWLGDVKFQGSTPDGHQVAIDGPPEAGGENAGVRPMELILLGVGACSAFDVMTILKKGRQRVIDCQCEVTGQRADTVPKVFTDIHLHFTISGIGLNEKQVERAIRLSADKYCSASIMLSKVANVTHDFELVDEN